MFLFGILQGNAKTNWIWMRNWTAEDKEEAALVLF